MRLAMRLYSGTIGQARERLAVEANPEQPAIKPETRPIDEKPEIEPRRPQYSVGVQLSLLDLWGMTEEVKKKDAPAKKKKTAKKESAAKRVPPKPKSQVTAVPTAETAKPANGDKEAKPENDRKQNGKSSVSCPLKPSDSAPLKHSTMPP